MAQEEKAEAQQERVDQVAHRKGQVRVVVERISKKESMVNSSDRGRIMERIMKIKNRIP